MATVNKNFRIKDGLVVEGTTGTINGNDILTTASSTNNLPEGADHLYFTPQRALDATASAYDPAGAAAAAVAGLAPNYITSVDTVNLSVVEGYLSLNSELELQKTSYWRSGTQQGVIAAQSDSSLRLTAITGQLQLESNAGDVRINPASTVTWFNNNLQINGDGGIITTDVNSLHLNADNGVITTDAQEFHTAKVELWNGGDTNGSRLGIIVAHPYDGSLTVAASNQLVLESHSGDINLVPDGQVVVNGNLVASNGHNITASNNVYAAQGLYVGGTDYEQNGFVRIQDGSGNNLFTVDTSSGEAEIDVHGFQKFYTQGGTEYGVIGYDGGANLVINGYNNDLILTSDSGYAYIGNNSSPATRIATQSYVDGVAQGLNVKQSVLLAVTDGSINLSTFNIDGGVLDGNNAVQAGSRVLLLAQATATENGIYVAQNDGTLARATDQATVTKGDFALVETGTHASQGWIVTDATAGTWSQFSAAGEYTAGTGITINNGAISVTANTYDAYGAASSAITTANGYTDTAISGLSTVYDPAGAAGTAETNAKNYADGLASNYDASGVASGLVNNLTNGTTAFSVVNIDTFRKEEATQQYVSTATTVDVHSFGYPYESAKYLVRVVGSVAGVKHSQLTEILVTVDGNDNIAITEYGTICTTGTDLASFSARLDQSGATRYVLTATTAVSGCEVIAAATLLSYAD